jgi:phenylalanyl-tRNA synthetase beta chain
MLAGVITGSLQNAGWWGKPVAYSWSEVIGQVGEMLALSGANFEVVSSDLAPWHPGRCAEFLVNGKPVAHAGEIHPRICREFGLPVGSTAFGILLGAFEFQAPRKAEPVWSMPAAIQDISLFVDSSTSSAQVEAALREGAWDLLESITLFDRYEKPDDASRVSLAYTLVFRASDRTLTADEVTGYREAAGNRAVELCGAILRSE